MSTPNDPTRRILFGSWTDGMDADPAKLDATAARLGVPLSIASIFRGEGDEWPYPTDETLGRGRILLVSWHLGDIGDFAYWAGGHGDGLLTVQAERLRRYGGLVVVRPWAEMNADWVDFQPTPAGHPPKPLGGSHAEFIAAWRHVVDVMRSRGAVNVRWAFNPTTDTYAETTDVADIYPGDDHVDYLALDGYNWGDGDGLTWRTFEDVYRLQYERLVTLGPSKPLWIAEIGSSDPHSASPSEQGISAPTGTDKGAWWLETMTSIRHDFPQIDAVVLFDADKERDWRCESSPSALQGLCTAFSH